MRLILSIAVGYLLGSISFGYLAGKLLKGIDIREYGSGNTGTTNIQRTLGTVPALLVLLLDFGKGFLAVFLAGRISGVPVHMMLAGVAAVSGHNWPLFLRFRGGRGVATSMGVLAGLAPKVFLFATLTGVLVIAVTRYVSLGSITGGVLLPFFAIAFGMPAPYIIFSAALGGLVVWRHRENIRRLRNGTENRLGERVEVTEKRWRNK